MKDLLDNEIIDLRSILNLFDWGITDEVHLEIDSQQLDNFFPIDQATIVAVSIDDIEDLRRHVPTLSEFDMADQSLITAALRDEHAILTDDGELYMECLALGIITMRLPQFCLSLAIKGMMDKTNVFQALCFWENVGRYSKKLIKKWKNELNEIRGLK